VCSLSSDVSFVPAVEKHYKHNNNHHDAADDDDARSNDCLLLYKTLNIRGILVTHGAITRLKVNV